MLIYQQMIYREDLRRNPSVLYVFGDNMQRLGLGGQAKEMRGERNAVGIITKRYPSNNQNAFLTDADFPEWEIMSMADFIRLKKAKRAGRTIVWPANGIGTGLARLDVAAPTIFAYIKEFEKSLNR